MPRNVFRHALRVLVVGATILLGAAPPAGAHPGLDSLEQAVDAKLAERPDDPDLILRQAKVYELRQDWDGALAAIEHAREHGGDPAHVAAARGRVFLAAGFPKMAQLEYDRVLSFRPDAFEILFDRGRARLALGQPDSADADFARAIANMKELRPEHVAERRDALLTRGKKAGAIAALDQGIARLGPLASLELPAVELEVELERWDGALARLGALLQQAPANTAWMVRRGEVLARAGRTAEARAQLARALAALESRSRSRRDRATQELVDRAHAALASSTTEISKGNP